MPKQAGLELMLDLWVYFFKLQEQLVNKLCVKASFQWWLYASFLRLVVKAYTILFRTIHFHFRKKQRRTLKKLDALN